MVGGCPSPLLPLASVSTPPMWHPPSPPAAAFLCRPPSSSSVVWGERRRCEPLRMFDDHQGGQGQQRPPKRQHGAGIRGGSSHRPGWQKAERELWEARRGIARGVLRPVAKLVQRKERLLQERLAKGGVAAAAENKEDVRNAVVATALLLAVVAAVGRMGGRAAVLGMLGLDMLKDADLAGKLDVFLRGIQELGPLKLPAFFALWVVAKTLCVDALALVLALASGVVFGGVVEGAAYSTVCATLASLVGFQLARTLFREQMVAQLEKRPLLRALERAVAKDGAKAVFTFRLSPLVPALPIGGYNYLYGVTSISAPEFLAGIGLGSLKPYLLDAYLGVWGKDLLLQPDAGFDLTQSALLFLTFSVLVLVGTLAAQIAGRAFDEAKQEAIAMMPASGEGQEGEEGTLGWFAMLGVERPKKGLLVEEWRRLDQAVQEEWRAVMSSDKQQQPQQQQGKGEGGQREGLVVPPYMAYDPAGQRPPRPFQKPPGLLDTMVGLTLFPIVLLGAATGKLSDAISSASSPSSPSSSSASSSSPSSSSSSLTTTEKEEGEKGEDGDNDSSSYPPTRPV